MSNGKKIWTTQALMAPSGRGPAVADYLDEETKIIWWQIDPNV